VTTRITEPRRSSWGRREAVVAGTRARETSLRILDELFGPMGSSCATKFRLWDGTVWEPERTRPCSCTITLTHPGALRRMFLPPGDLAAGEAFVRGDFDIDGDAEVACETGFRAGASLPRTVGTLTRLGARLLSLPGGPRADPGPERFYLRGPAEREHSRERDMRAVRHHYDVGNDFYGLWLGDRMIYSCAYFEHGDQDIDSAQIAKLDHICRKLRLSGRDRLLDIGCGWGGLVIHAAREYGVKAVGITLSERQASFADRRVKAQGLSDSVRIEVLDYREAPCLGSFDKIVSVGMVEHVGIDHLCDYFRIAFELLDPGGLFLNHGITSAQPFKHDRDSFIKRYVFPDGELETIGQTLQLAESAGFEVRDVESLREHYMRTLPHWVRRLEDNADEAVRISSEETYRIWRLYMAGAAYHFRAGAIGVHQSLLAKPTGDVSGLPPTRAHVYPR
jgi:cyclopropane-fatty-acyl-phospholipid synthase